MSKAKAEIVGGVNIGDGTVYVPGMEEQLARKITPAQIKHLTEQGAITGSWTVVMETSSGSDQEPASEKGSAKDAKEKN
jgi:hypothetical protein